MEKTLSEKVSTPTKSGASTYSLNELKFHNQDNSKKYKTLLQFLKNRSCKKES